MDRLFRQEYGRLVASLSRRVGVQHIASVEDAVQSAMMAALEHWSIAGTPEKAGAWLFRAAHNELMGSLRRSARRDRLLELHSREEVPVRKEDEDPRLAGEVQDDFLRMLFICCDDAISVDSQIVFALKTLGGFDVREIAARLFTSEANVYKRLARARDRFRQSPPRDELTHEELAARLPAVHAALYLLFTEGHLSSNPDAALRRELCDEALRLAVVLAMHPLGQTPETSALVALMYLHLSRMDARQDVSGGLLLLEEQDRTRFRSDEILLGLRWLAKSASGDRYSRYHAEAGIAAEHCLARTFEETRWDVVVEHYEALEQLGGSVLHRLNRAIAVAEWRGAEAGLEVLAGLEPPTWLVGSYLWSAVLAHLHGGCGHREIAARYRTLALDGAPNAAVKASLERRLRAR